MNPRGAEIDRFHTRAAGKGLFRRKRKAHRRTSAQAKRHAAACSGAMRLKGGSVPAQTAAARGYRVRNRQPLGGRTGSGGSPSRANVSVIRLPPMLGTAANSDRV